MRKSLFILVFLSAIGISNAQEINPLPTKGEIVRLGKPSGTRYQHIGFLRKNIIIKRGAIANFSHLVGKRLIVESISQNEDGSSKVILRRKDGLNFFRFYPTIEASFEQALEKNELVRKF